MTLRSTSNSYGSVAVAIHWLSVILIVVLLASGFRADAAPDDAGKIMALRVHVPAGISILVLTLARIAWWLFADKKPDAASGTPAWQDRIARWVHLAFYLVLLGMAASGIGMLVLSGAGSTIFGGSPLVLLDFQTYPPRLPHGFGARLMIALLVAHGGAALYHQFVLRDGALRRMWFS